MVSAILFDWFADFGKKLTIIQQSSQSVYSDEINGKHPGGRHFETVLAARPSLCDVIQSESNMAGRGGGKEKSLQLNLGLLWRGILQGKPAL